MRVLLTGATGFVGAHVLAKLIANHADVAIILRDNSNSWRIENYLDKVSRITASLDNLQSVQTQIIDFAPNILIHLAWDGVENKYRNEPQQITSNLNQILNLIEIAKLTEIKTIIGLGSQAEYGLCDNKPIAEGTPSKPITWYGVAKINAYHVLDFFARQNQIRFAWLRLFSAYGPMENTAWLIPNMISHLTQGKHMSLTPGEQQWDYVYVADAAQAIVDIATTAKAEGIFNLASGTTNSIRKIAESIRDMINPELKLGFGEIPYRPDQVMFLQANINRLKNATGWQPQIDLSKGLRLTVDWYLQKQTIRQ